MYVLNYAAISYLKADAIVKCCIIYFAHDNYNLFETRGKRAAVHLSNQNSR